MENILPHSSAAKKLLINIIKRCDKQFNSRWISKSKLKEKPQAYTDMNCGWVLCMIVYDGMKVWNNILIDNISANNCASCSLPYQKISNFCSSKPQSSSTNLEGKPVIIKSHNKNALWNFWVKILEQIFI